MRSLEVIAATRVRLCIILIPVLHKKGYEENQFFHSKIILCLYMYIQHQNLSCTFMYRYLFTKKSSKVVAIANYLPSASKLKGGALGL